MAEQDSESKGAAPSGGSLRQDAPAQVGELLGLLTHDLRNPLAALASNVGFLQMVSTEMAPEAKEAIDDLQISVEALGRIADGLELLGHELCARSSPPPSPQDADSIIRSVQKTALRSAASHGVKLLIDEEAARGIRFSASALPFAKALSALIHNALTVTPPGSEVSLSVVERGDEVVFRIEDSGPALSGEMLRELATAEAQNRLKSDRKARYSRGLGLFTVLLWSRRAGVSFLVGKAEVGSALELAAARQA